MENFQKFSNSQPICMSVVCMSLSVCLHIIINIFVTYSRDGMSDTGEKSSSIYFSSPDMLVAVSRGMWAIIICFKTIDWVAGYNTQVNMCSGYKMVVHVHVLANLVNCEVSVMPMACSCCCQFISQLLESWPKHCIERHLSTLQEAIKRGLSDADSDARTHSRR